MGHAGPALLAILIMAVPGAIATPTGVPVSGYVEAVGSTELTGVRDLSLDAWGIWGRVDGVRTAPLIEGAAVGVATLIDIPRQRLVVAPPGQEEIGVGLIPQETVLHERGIEGGIAVHALSGNNTVRIFSAEAAPVFRSLSINASSLIVPAPQRQGPSPFAVSLAHVGAVQGHRLRPPGWNAWIPQGPETVDLAASHVLLVHGGRLQFADGEVWNTGSASFEDVVRDPITGTRLESQSHTVALLEMRQSRLALNEPNSWYTIAKASTGSLDGEILWTGAQASMTAGGTDLPNDDQLLLLRGTVWFTASLSQPQSQWRINGTARHVAVDGEPWLDGLDASLVVATGLLAVLLLSLTAAGKSLLTLVAGRHTPGLVKAKPLGSRSRQVIMSAIHALQPATVMVLADATGLSTATIRYHLRILDANEFIDSTRRDGARRVVAYFLNSGSASFAAGTNATVSARAAMAAMHVQPTRSAIFDVIWHHGPIAWRDVAVVLEQRGGPLVARSTASQHLVALQSCGAISSSRQGPRLLYSANASLGNLRGQQFRRYLTAEGLVPLYQAMARGPVATDDAEDVLLAASIAKSKADARRRLRRHVAMGAIAFEASNGVYTIPASLRTATAEAIREPTT